MPAHGKYGKTRAVRWNKEYKYFEMQCIECKTYWPLFCGQCDDKSETSTYWETNRQLQRCKACSLPQRRRIDSEYRARPEIAAKKIEYNRQYHKDNRPIVLEKMAVRTKNLRVKKALAAIAAEKSGRTSTSA